MATKKQTKKSAVKKPQKKQAPAAKKQAKKPAAAPQPKKKRAAPPADKPNRAAIEKEEQHEAEKAEPKETPQELKKAVERTKSLDACEVQPVPAPKEEVERLRKLGLEEKPVRGTMLMLVGLIDEKKAPPTNEQILEIAKRLNEVGPRLPHYVKHLANEKKPLSTQQAIVDVARTVASGDQVRAEAAKAKAKEEKKQGKPAAKKEGSASRTAAKKGDGKPAEKKGGIGGLVSKMLLDGKETEAILAAVKKDYPHAKTSAASVAWYRSQLRGEGKLK